ncbi:hypothetical protein EYF80_008584 [Liparis tanakae]|uniref:Uncharacterized protein n=1 Tax=Liparis tanakae TaxID=230148 RepID=A0A4Z2ITD1_9TELE|nr:hypothetical protein EYF80_008584 [Liparis tanakae]
MAIPKAYECRLPARVSSAVSGHRAPDQPWHRDGDTESRRDAQNASERLLGHLGHRPNPGDLQACLHSAAFMTKDALN